MLKNTKISHKLAQKADKLIINLGFKEKKIIFISDEKIWQNCQKYFSENFLTNFDKILLLKNPKADEKNLKKILKSTKNFDLILALGSGVINDLCKLSSAQNKIPYAIFASAPSMNGYLSRNASITISGHKKTIPATLPLAVFCDLDILKSAPKELIKAGIGDVMCFYSCWFDWYLSHLIFKTEFNQKPFKILEKKMAFLVKNYQKFSLNDDGFLKILIEILLLSGQGMTISGGSYPASQSEHLIAHTLEMKYPEKLHRILHGNQIAVTTLTSANLQKKLLEKDVFKIKKTEFDLKDLEKFFGKKIATQCKKEFEQKMLNDDQLKAINENLKNNWKLYRKKLIKIHFSELRLQKIFSHFRVNFLIKALTITNQEYQLCLRRAKSIRNRFTCLDFF